MYRLKVGVLGGEPVDEVGVFQDHHSPSSVWIWVAQSHKPLLLFYRPVVAGRALFMELDLKGRVCLSLIRQRRRSDAGSGVKVSGNEPACTPTAPWGVVAAASCFQVGGE